MVYPYNFGHILRILMKFCIMKEAKRYVKIKIFNTARDQEARENIDFLENFHLGQMRH